MRRGDTAWMDQHLADDVVWHVGGNSKWAGAYQGKAKVLEFFARQAQSTAGPVGFRNSAGCAEQQGRVKR
jgi:ketosteroid isomerase-like protein